MCKEFIEKQSTIIFTIGFGLLAVPTFVLLLSSLLFVLGFSINPIIFPVSIVSAILLMYFTTKQNKKDFYTSTGGFFLVLAISILLSTLFDDNSWDGQAYHQDTILQLKNGWNPVYEHHSPHSHHALWVDHYAKGIETIAAAIYSTTGSIEVGKAVNFILIFSSLFLFFNFLGSHSLSSKKRIFLAVLFTLCPVVANQMFTFYIDWSAYSLLLILIPTLIDIGKNSKTHQFIIIGFIILLSSSIKFNIFFWIVFTVFSYLIYFLCKKKYKLLKGLITTSVISALFVLLVTFNPYITNIIDHQNPFYPLAGEDKTDIMTVQEADILRNKSRVESVFISLFLFPNQSSSCQSVSPPKYAFPSNLLKFSKYDIVALGMSDIRLGGFGLFFSWILILSTMLYCCRRKIRDGYRTYTIFLLVLFGSLFILPSGWWARYVPFFYAFPLIMLLYTERDRSNRYVAIFRNIIYSLLVVNISLSICCSCIMSIRVQNKINNYVTVLSQSTSPIQINFGGNIGFKIKLDKKDIQYQETSNELATILPTGPPVFLDPELFEVIDKKLIKK